MIEGTNMKVIELVLNHTIYGWEPDELQENHPYLTLGQIYSTLAFYWDHKDEVDQDIQRRLQHVDDLQSMLKPSRIRERLKVEGAHE